MKPYVPKWEGEFPKTAMKMSMQHQWRTFPDYDYEELFSEAALIFVTCRKRYCLDTKKVKNAKHFMSIFKRSFINKINSIAKSRTRRRTCALSQLTEHSQSRVMAKKAINTKDWRIIRNETTGVTKRVLNILFDCRIQHKFRYTQVGDFSVRESVNDYLCRVAKVDPSRYNLAHEIRGLLE